MKTAFALASTLASAGTALAAPTSWTGPYKLVAFDQFGTAFNNSTLGTHGGVWYVGNTNSDSSCGDAPPAVSLASDGSIGFHADGRQNQQFAFVDNSDKNGARFGFTLPNQFENENQEGHKFGVQSVEEGVISLTYDGDDRWLACPSEEFGSSQNFIYPKKSWRDPASVHVCYDFSIRAVPIETPSTVCVYN